MDSEHRKNVEKLAEQVRETQRIQHEALKNRGFGENKQPQELINERNE